MSRRNPLRSRRGVSAVEFALLAPVLMLFGLGTLEYGRLAWTQEALEAAAAAGARCMGVLASDCAAGGAYSAANAKTYIVNQAANWKLTLTPDTITTTRPTTCAGVDKFSTVAITYKFETVLPLLVTTLANGINLSVSACYPNTR